MRRATLVAILSMTIVGSCGATADPVQSPATPASVLEQEPEPTPTSSIAEATSAAAQPTATPKVGRLKVRWTADTITGAEPISGLVGVASRSGTSVLVVAPPYTEDRAGYAAWLSKDGLAWEPVHAFPADARVHSVVAAGPTFVASGWTEGRALVWTSADGRRWQEVEDPSLGAGVINQLLVTDSGIVGLGWSGDDGKIWTSADGLEWLAATNGSGLAVARGLQAAGTYDGRAIAIVGSESGPASVWETTGRAEWTRVGRLPEKIASVRAIAGGERGWVALGSTSRLPNAAWTSADGRTWSKAVAGPDVAADVIVDDAGYVAVGYVGSLPGETCGDQRQFGGHTWTSTDGRTWTQMHVTKQFRSAWVQDLQVEGRTLVGIGQRFDSEAAAGSDTMEVARWTAPLPGVSRAAAESDEGSVPRTCGG